MTEKKIKTPLNVFQDHGVDISAISNEQARGTCPFCDKVDHLYLRYAGYKELSGGRKSVPGMWDCKACMLGGNVYTFLYHLAEESKRTTTPADYLELWKKKKIPPAAGRMCGISRSLLTGEWIIPTRKKSDNKRQKYIVSNIHRWHENKNQLFGTVTMTTDLIGLEHLSPEAKPLILGEGHWDRPILEHIYRDTGDRDSVDLLSAPGAGSFKTEWLTYFHRRPSVTLLFDNDHPKTNPKSGKVTQAGLDGVKRIAEMVLSMDDDVRPLELRYLKWPMLELVDGYDLRDLYIDFRKPQERIPVCLR